MTRQNFGSFGEVLAFMVQHAEQQGRYGMGELRGLDRCRYRGDNGTACMVGAIIADEDYYFGLEGKGASSGKVVEAVQENCAFPLKVSEVDFLVGIQGLHDTMAKNAESYSWFLQELRRTVERYLHTRPS